MAKIAIPGLGAMGYPMAGQGWPVRSLVYGGHGALAGMEKGSILVDHTTASAVLAKELFEKAKALGVGFIDAPISGGQAGAQNAQLGITCGGDAAENPAVHRPSTE